MKKSGVTLGKLRERYILTITASGAAPLYVELTVRILEFIVDGHYGLGADLEIRNLEEEAILRYLITRKKLGKGGLGITHTTLNTEFLTLRRFFNWIRKAGFTEERFLSTLTAPRPDRKVFDPFTNQEINRIFKAVRRSPQETAMFAILLDTGIRRQELYSLPLAGLDQQNMTVRVLGKGRKWRVVPYGRTTRRIMARHLAWRELVNPECDSLFFDQFGGELNQNKMQSIIARVRKQADVPRMHFHLFRATYATRFLLAGGDTFLLRHNLGHSTFSSVSSYLRIASSLDHELSRKSSLMDRAIRSISSLNRGL